MPNKIQDSKIDQDLLNKLVLGQTLTVDNYLSILKVQNGYIYMFYEYHKTENDWQLVSTQFVSKGYMMKGVLIPFNK